MKKLAALTRLAIDCSSMHLINSFCVVFEICRIPARWWYQMQMRLQYLVTTANLDSELCTKVSLVYIAIYRLINSIQNDRPIIPMTRKWNVLSLIVKCSCYDLLHDLAPLQYLHQVFILCRNSAATMLTCDNVWLHDWSHSHIFTNQSVIFIQWPGLLTRAFNFWCPWPTSPVVGPTKTHGRQYRPCWYGEYDKNKVFSNAYV